MINDIKNITDFASAIKHDTVVIDFYSNWCEPCKQMMPSYIKLSKTYNNVKFYKLNIDDENISKIIQVCEIESLPTICFFKNGKYITKIIGSNISDINNVIIKMLNSD